jgi:nucleotide-binding universal stress UspA family protein
MDRTLLVPLDGSPLAEQALPLALEIAERANASVRLVHVHPPGMPGGSGPGSDPRPESAVRESEQAYLNGAAQRVATASPVRVAAELLDGPVAATLCGRAAATGTDLIVMATHGRGPLTRFWLGSVADQVIRQAPVPVLLVRPRDGAPDLAWRPRLRHILIPLDGSALAEQALGPATAMGRLLKVDYTLLRAIEPIILPDPRFGGNPVAGLDPTLLRALQEAAQADLNRVADRLRSRALHVRMRVVSNQPAAVAILDEAGGGDVDLIALATHGRGGLPRLLLGSVADKVVRGSPVPVLVYRPRAG